MKEGELEVKEKMDYVTRLQKRICEAEVQGMEIIEIRLCESRYQELKEELLKISGDEKEGLEIDMLLGIPIVVDNAVPKEVYWKVCREVKVR